MCYTSSVSRNVMQNISRMVSNKTHFLKGTLARYTTFLNLQRVSGFMARTKSNQKTSYGIASRVAHTC